MSETAPVITESHVHVSAETLETLARDRLVLSAEERRWGRRRVVTEKGRELLLALPTGSLLVAGHVLYVGSGYRSQAYQVAVFAAQVVRWGDEDIANRYSARPGHSQHQLGTTIDFTTSFGAFIRIARPPIAVAHS